MEVQLGRQVRAPARLDAGELRGPKRTGQSFRGLNCLLLHRRRPSSPAPGIFCANKQLADALISRNEAPLLSCSLDVSSTTQTGKTKKSQGVRLGLGRIGGRLQGSRGDHAEWPRPHFQDFQDLGSHTP